MSDSFVSDDETTEETPDLTKQNENMKYWTKLAEYSLDKIRTGWNYSLSEMISIDNNEFVVLPSRSYQAYPKDEDYYIIKYNTMNNEWTNWIKVPDTFRHNNHTMSINKSKSSIYIYGGSGDGNKNFAIIDIKSARFSLPDKCIEIGYDAASFVIDDIFHIIGGGRSIKHQIWNNKENKLESIYEFDEFQDGLIQHRIIHIPSKQEILLLGGYSSSRSGDDDEYTDSMYLYSIQHNKWNKVNTKLPKRMCAFGSILTFNEKYVIILGGDAPATDYNVREDTIHVLNLHDMKIRECAIKCAVMGEYRAVIMNNFEMTDLLTMGYIRYLWTFSEFKTFNFLPMDIIKMINKWHCREIIHLIQNDAEKNCHFKINVDDILSNLLPLCTVTQT